MPHSEDLTNGHSGNGSKPTRRGVYLLTHPRSASNLFQTMMAKQRSHGKDVQCFSYHFFDASFPTMMHMNRGSLESASWSPEDRAALYEPYKAAFEKLNQELTNAEANVSLLLINSEDFSQEEERGEVMFSLFWWMTQLCSSMACSWDDPLTNHLSCRAGKPLSRSTLVFSPVQTNSTRLHTRMISVGKHHSCCAMQVPRRSLFTPTQPIYPMTSCLPCSLSSKSVTPF
jgi:hypothetical protein